MKKALLLMLPALLFTSCSQSPSKGNPQVKIVIQGSGNHVTHMREEKRYTIELEFDFTFTDQGMKGYLNVYYRTGFAENLDLNFSNTYYKYKDTKYSVDVLSEDYAPNYAVVGRSDYVKFNIDSDTLRGEGIDPATLFMTLNKVDYKVQPIGFVN